MNKIINIVINALETPYVTGSLCKYTLLFKFLGFQDSGENFYVLLAFMCIFLLK